MNTVVFNRLLLNFNLNQHISFPTHDFGHILDLIITNASSKLAIYPNSIDTCISDQKTVYIDLDIQKPVAEKSLFTFRPSNKINFTDFNNDITAAFLNFEHLDLKSLVTHFNSLCHHYLINMLRKKLFIPQLVLPIHSVHLIFYMNVRKGDN